MSNPDPGQFSGEEWEKACFIARYNNLCIDTGFFIVHVERSDGYTAFAVARDAQGKDGPALPAQLEELRLEPIRTLEWPVPEEL